MKIKIMTLLATAALAMPAASLAADVPQRGMSQSQVRAEFGAPNQSKGPVGSPAITRWFYNGFTVYFENNTALHTVIDRPASAAPDVVSGQQVDTLPPIEEKATVSSNAPASTDPAPDSDDTQGGPVFDPVSGRFVSEDDNDATPASSPESKSAASTQNQTTAAAPETKATATSEKAPASDTAKAAPAAAAATGTAAAKANATTPATAPATNATSEGEGEFRFDPVTGRIIIAGEDTPEQAAQKQAASMKKEAQQSADQVSESASKTVEDSEAEANKAVNDVSEKAEAAQAQAEETVAEQAEEVEQTQQAAQDAANDVQKSAEEDADGGGFYIDWGARQ